MWPVYQLHSFVNNVGLVIGVVLTVLNAVNSMLMMRSIVFIVVWRLVPLLKTDQLV